MQTAINAHTIATAGRHLGRFFITRAARAAKDIGFGYWPADDAPGTYPALMAEIADCLKTRRAMRVWSGGSDSTVYGSAEANYAFRYLHDLGHYIHGLTFSYAHEVELARIQAAQVAQAFGKDSLELLVYRADTEGQSTFNDAYGAFPEDQARFVLHVALHLSQGATMRQAVALAAPFVGLSFAPQEVTAVDQAA
ncbi:MAG: hypothetical protein GXC94_02030 [Comamonadaceae bacterium]|nr:hypothetical protein [Comamonadaceae bacterium]